MIILDSSYDELDDNIERLLDGNDYEEEVMVAVNSDEAIVLFEPAWRIKDKKLIAVEGVYGSFDKTANNFEPDWSLTVIYENVPDDEFDPEKWLYIEQDPITTAIHNFLQMRQKT